MPLTGTYNFSQTVCDITLCIPLKGTPPRALDVLLTRNTLRVSYLPFLIDLNLAHDVDDVNSKAVLKDGVLTITLIKLEDKIWDNLLYEGEDIAKRRAKALSDRTERVQRQHQQVQNRKVEEERMTLRGQVALEENERQMIDGKKAEEKQAAEQELYKAFVEMETAKQKAIEGTVADDTADNSNTAVPITDKPVSFPNEEEHDAAAVNTTMAEPTNNKVSFSADDTSIPPPRKAVRATFSHTPRLFKTPSRESTAKQEQEFIMKNQSHLSNNSMLNNDNKDAPDIADADPVWLMRKADSFLSNGDHRSAINAYSSALEVDDTMVHALANRATCYLHLGVYELCKTDCTTALILLGKRNTSHDDADASFASGPVSDTEERRKLEVTLLRRRSVARMHLLEHQGSIDDKFNAKQKLRPEDKATLQELDQEIADVEVEKEGYDLRYLVRKDAIDAGEPS